MADHGFEVVAARALDELNDFAALLDVIGNVEWANNFAYQLLGYSGDELTGTSMAVHVHPDDLARALVIVERLSEDTGTVPVTPALYRLLRKDGSWVRIELNATRVRGPDGDHLAVFGRYSGDHDLHDRITGLLTAGAPAADAVALVPEFGLWRHPGSDYAVFFLDDDGRPGCAGSARLASLGGLDDPTTPWTHVACTGDEMLAAIDELDVAYASSARAAGFTHLWGMPVEDPLHGSYAVVAFGRREDGAAPEVYGYAIGVMAKALQLILLWRHQVLSLRRAARLDALTGVANRGGFWDALDALEQRGTTATVGVFFVDPDEFTDVNDRFGHSVGDMVLVEVARRLEHVVRPGDVVARLGGDEFAVVASSLGGDEDATAIAERIVNAMAEPFVVAGEQLVLGASVGVATVDELGFDSDEFLEQADRALYLAKQAGRGRWARATSEH